MSILRTYNVQNPDSTATNIQLTANGGLVVAGIITANSGFSSVTVGDKFISSSGIGLGQTTTTGRNAGINTALGTLIYNSTTATVQYYDGVSWYDSNASQFIQATGGTVTNYNVGSVVWTAHTFTSSGTWIVSSAPPTANTVEYLVVAGGGGAGSNNGGGGAGGFRSGIGFTVSTSPGSYTVTIEIGRAHV